MKTIKAEHSIGAVTKALDYIRAKKAADRQQGNPGISPRVKFVVNGHEHTGALRAVGRPLKDVAGGGEGIAANPAGCLEGLKGWNDLLLKSLFVWIHRKRAMGWTLRPKQARG